ncbi:MAG: ABC transporter substrate-binding protein [Pseudomonadota bacterium]
MTTSMLRAGGAMLLGCALLLSPVTGAAQQAKVTLRTGILKVLPERLQPISRMDEAPEDLGFAGAERGRDDNATTGRFLGHAYETVEAKAKAEDAVAALDAMLAEGVRAFVVMADAETLLALADHAAEAAPEALIVNAQARDTRLRSADCRANVLHVAPSRAMLADGLAQYLMWKKWDAWMLVHGDAPGDVLMGEAYAAAGKKFGATIAETRVFEDTEGMRRSDSGHVLVQRQIPVFMQRSPEHDIVVVADENELFGAYLPYRTWEARPVAGDAGLRVRSWHPSHESFGATQLQRRFEKQAGRYMDDLDYQAWLSERVLGEAVTRTGSSDPAALKEYILSDAFEIAGFKGQALTFRPWNHQLRHGVLLADGRTVVTVSPQEEYLHQRTRLDTLGLDEPESDCDLN